MWCNLEWDGVKQGFSPRGNSIMYKISNVVFLFYLSIFICFCFETQCHYVAVASLELTM